MRTRRTLGVALLLLAGLARPAAALTAHLLTGAGFVNHTPGADLRIGTVDDTVESGGVGPNQSGPNAHGAASFALLNPGGSAPDAASFAYVLFVDGPLEFTPDYASSTADKLVLTVTGGSLRSTAEFSFQTRGEATTTITGGSANLDPMTGAGTVQLSGSFAPSSAPAFTLTNETLTAAPGKGTIVLAASFGHSGDAYIDGVLTPLVPAGATAIVLVEFTGTVVSPGCCTGFVTHGVLAAYTTDALGCAAVFPALCPAGGSACQTIADCAAKIGPTLPTPATASSKRARKVAVRLGRLASKANGLIGRAGTASGKKQAGLYRKARKLLQMLLAAAQAADGKGTLGVPLPPLQAAVNALLAKLPPS